MVICAFGFLVGCGFINLITKVPDVIPILLATVLSMSVALKLKKKLGFKLTILIMIFTLSVSLGFFWACIQAKPRINPNIEVFNPQNTIKGVVQNVLYQATNTIRFEFRVTELCDSAQLCTKINASVRLYWTKPKYNLHHGDELAIQAKLKPPYDLSNPGTQSKTKQYFLNNLIANGKVLQIARIKANLKISLRDKLEHNLNTSLDNSAYKGIVTALVIGKQSEISTKQWQTFRATGTSHLMAISGLHIGLVAGLFYLLAFKGWVRSKWVAQMPAQNIAPIFAIIGALFYANLAGWSIPTQRACIMITVMMLGVMLRQPILRGSVLCAAALIILIVDPFAIFRAGFWLSFSAVGLLMLSIKMHPNAKRIKRWLYPQVYLFVGMMPLTLFWFEQASIISPFANLIAIPWMSFIVVPCALVGALLSFSAVGQMILQCSVFFLNCLMCLLDFLADYFPVVNLYVPWPVLLLVSLGCILCCLPKNSALKKIGLICFVPLFLPSNNALEEGQFKCHILDVGQGTSLILQTRNHLVIYDFGAKLYSGFDAGAQVLNPYLRRLRIKKIDLAIISHHDNDHEGGFKAVRDNHKIESTMSSSHTKAQQFDILCRNGMRWDYDGVRFEILHPENLLKKKNNQSCVLKVSTHNQSLLIPGDIEAVVENELVKSYADKLKADILLVPHHGSKTSSSESFIQSVMPKVAIITVGFNNRYQLPKQEVVERYKAYKIEVLNTYQTGAIQLLFNDKPISISKWRVLHQSLWNNLRTKT